MGAGNERGEGKLGMVVGIVVLILGGYLLVNAAPPYFANWTLSDKIETAALGPPTPAGDTAARKKIWAAVEDLGLDQFLAPQDITVERRGSNRYVHCAYEREVTFLPGYSKIIFFEHEVEQVVF